MGLETVGLALAIGGGGLEAGGKIMAGRERSRAQGFEATQKDREAEELRIASAQTEARRREHLTSSLETIMSIRAGRGVGEASPTAMASYEEIISDESRDMRTERYNYLSRAEQARLAAKMSRRQAKFSLISSYVDAGAGLLKTGSKIGGSMGGYGGSKGSADPMSGEYK
jgi:hypothetical protein